MVKCDHYWCYEHTVYSSSGGAGTLVRKWCSNCEVEMVGHVTKWRKARPKEFDTPANLAAVENLKRRASHIREESDEQA